MADTLCFIPCCKRKKTAAHSHLEPPVPIAERIPSTWQRLRAGRTEMSACIEWDGQPDGALMRYDGGLYNAHTSFRDDLLRDIRIDRIDLYILSAGYGIIHALDPILPYEAEMKGKVAKMWRNIGLMEVIAELIRVSGARRVFGFFSGPAHWSGAHAKYRHFFTEGVKAAASSGAALDIAVCFYRHAGLGTGAITGALGRALSHGLHEDFSRCFMAEYAIGHADGSVIVRSETLAGAVPGDHGQTLSV